MKYVVFLSEKASMEFKNLPIALLRRILGRFKSLVDNPYPYDSTYLITSDGLSLWVILESDYFIHYRVDEYRYQVEIWEILHQSKVN
jgi:mRNA-degrading endonuclease RelE of RelBE toxin-antitoxin system